MSSHGFRERILEINVAGSALASSTAQTSIMPSAHLTAALPVGYYDRGPRAIHFEFNGIISTLVTTPGTLQLGFRFNSTDVFLSGLMTLNIVAKTNVGWTFAGKLLARSANLGGSTSTQLFPLGCYFESEAVIGAAAPTAGGIGRHSLPYNTQPALGSGFDNGLALGINLMGQWSVLSASNSIQVLGGHVDINN